MSQQHSTSEEFFKRLTSLFEAQRQVKHGSVHLTQKRLSPPDGTKSKDTQAASTGAFADLQVDSPLPILVRATDGRTNRLKKSPKEKQSIYEKNSEKVKLSTIVQPDQVDAFFRQYADVCKAGMSGLKKRDRSGRKKAKDKKKKQKDKKGIAA